MVRETGGLYQRKIQEESRQRADWVATQKARARRGKKKSQYELALEKARIANREDYDIKLRRENDGQDSEIDAGEKLLRDVFPDEITLRAAVQFRAVKLRKAYLQEAYFDPDDGRANYKRWNAIGQTVGWPRRT